MTEFNPKAFLEEKAKAKAAKAAEPKIIPAKTIEPVDPRGGLVTSWSLSRMQNYDRCPHMLWHAGVAKTKRERGPAAERGITLHKQAEDFIRCAAIVEGSLPTAFSDFGSLLHELNEEYPFGSVEVEQQWGYTIEFEDSEWFSDDTWLRVVCDVVRHESTESITLIDWKSGKKHPIAHTAQAQLYAICAFNALPETGIRANVLGVHRPERARERDGEGIHARCGDAVPPPMG
jgi:hypothetical protein